MKFGSDIHGTQWTNTYNFGDSLTSVAPPAGQNIYLSSEICQKSTWLAQYIDHVPRKMNLNNFSAPLTFYLALLSGQNVSNVASWPNTSKLSYSDILLLICTLWAN